MKTCGGCEYWRLTTTRFLAGAPETEYGVCFTEPRTWARDEDCPACRYYKARGGKAKPTQDWRVTAIFEWWKEQFAFKRVQLDSKRKGHILEALKIAAPERLCLALTGLRYNADDPESYWGGNNDRKRVYNDLIYAWTELDGNRRKATANRIEQMVGAIPQRKAAFEEAAAARHCETCRDGAAAQDADGQDRGAGRGDQDELPHMPGNGVDVGSDEGPDS